MSRRSWLLEFYPVPASKVPKDQAIAHSLKKWLGLLPRNLKRYGLKTAPLRIDSSTCALCHHYIFTVGCRNCPLTLVRGAPCDVPLNWEHQSPYQAWRLKQDPDPMIALLKAAHDQPPST